MFGVHPIDVSYSGLPTLSPRIQAPQVGQDPKDYLVHLQYDPEIFFVFISTLTGSSLACTELISSLASPVCCKVISEVFFSSCIFHSLVPLLTRGISRQFSKAGPDEEAPTTHQDLGYAMCTVPFISSPNSCEISWSLLIDTETWESCHF